MPFFLISVGSLALPGAFVFRFFKSFRGLARQLPCCLATLLFRGLYISSFHVFGLQLSISACASLRQARTRFQQLPQSLFHLCSLLVRAKRPAASFFVLLLAPFQTFAPVLLAATCTKNLYSASVAITLLPHVSVTFGQSLLRDFSSWVIESCARLPTSVQLVCFAGGLWPLLEAISVR